MSEISFFEVFAGTAVRPRPCSGRVSASSPCPSVPSRGVFPSFPVSLMSVFLLYLFLPGVPLSVPPWVARLRCPVACPCDSGPEGAACAVACLYCACRLPVACPGDVPQGDALLARRLPLRMRSAPRVSGGKAAAGGSGECRKVRGGRGKIEENRKKTEKGEKKSLKSLEIRQRALPLQSRSGRGPSGPSFCRGKFIESEEGSPSGAGGAGPLRPGGKPRPVQGKKTKVVLYNEEFDPGSG